MHNQMPGKHGAFRPVHDTRGGDRPASTGSPAHPILELQRSIGNRGVVELLSSAEGRPAPTIQRKVSVTSKDLRKAATFTGVLRAELGHQTTWSEIEQTFKKYEKARDKGDSHQEVRLLFALEMLGKEWLTAHGSSKEKADQQKAIQLRKMVAECDTELNTDRLKSGLGELYENRVIDTNLSLGHADVEDPRYRQRYSANKFKSNFSDSFKYLTESAFEDKKTSAGDQPGGTKMEHFGPMKQKLAGSGSRLTDAELAAIRIYSAGDYQTINPTLVGDDTWMKGNVKGLAVGAGHETQFARGDVREQLKPQNKDGDTRMTEGHRREMKLDAMMHTRMAVSGLKKLPDVTVDGYRGLSIPLNELILDYKVGKKILYKPFLSTSTDRELSKMYAMIPKVGKVGLLLNLKITGGKDIKEISVASKENEVLLLPGAEFEVTEAPKLVGNLYEATIKQVGAGGDLSSSAGPPVPLNNLAGNQQVPHSTSDKKAPSAGAAAGRDRGTQPAAADPLAAKAASTAKSLIAKAAKEEPQITQFLNGLCKKEKGCRLAGLEYKLKTEESLARKLEMKANTRVAKGGTNIDSALAEEAKAANDVLRYTIIAPPKIYREVEKRVRDAMQKNNYTIVNNWDAWSGVKTYKGLNMGFRSSGGLVFELQMHTDESFAMKQVIHEQYEEARGTGTSGERKKALENYMEGKWTGVTAPAAVKPSKGKK